MATLSSLGTKPWCQASAVTFNNTALIFFAILHLDFNFYFFFFFISFKLFPLSFFKEVHLQNSETTGFDLKKQKKKKVSEYQNCGFFFSVPDILCRDL